LIAMAAAVTNQGDLIFMVFDEHIAVRAFLEFLGWLIRQQTRPKGIMIAYRYAVRKVAKVAI